MKAVVQRWQYTQDSIFFSLDLSDYIGILKHGSFGISLQDFPITISCAIGTVEDKIAINGDKQHYDLDTSVDFDKLRHKIKTDKFYGECLPAVIEKDFEMFVKGIDKIVHL